MWFGFQTCSNRGDDASQSITIRESQGCAQSVEHRVNESGRGEEVHREQKTAEKNEMPGSDGKKRKKRTGTVRQMIAKV